MNMIKKLWAVGSALAVGSVCFFLYQSHATSWQSLYKKDLKAAHDILKDNHPGFYDNHNAEFKTWLLEGYQQALAKSPQVASFADYVYGLRFFTTGFKDSHVRVKCTSNTASLLCEWPGFGIGYKIGYRTGFGEDSEQQAEDFLVGASESSEIPMGARLIACDGESPRAWLEKNICPYIDSRNIDASWVVLAPYLSLWPDTVFIKKPTTYVFEINGKQKEVRPTWKKIEAADYSSKVLKKSSTPVLASIQEKGDRQVWITLPSFYPQHSTEEDALKKVIDSVEKYKNYDVIVFDLRGNGGGNSRYGTLILEKLYGQEYCNACFKKLHAPQYVEWRASQENIEYLKIFLVTLEQKFGKEGAAGFALVVFEMEKNLAVGNPFYRAMSDSVEATDYLVPQNPLHARVILITDTTCASSSLVFIDEIRAVDIPYQIGLPTNVDTEYLECRDVTLPSGLATLHFPIKVFRNRGRKPNEPYLPDQFVADVYNDEEIQKAINKVMNP
jgi:hypothetical protein